MIELKNDGLTFSFPEVKAALNEFGKTYCQSNLPRILQEDRLAAFHEVMATDYRFSSRRLTPKSKEAMRDLVLKLSPEQITEGLQKKIWDQIDSGWSNPGEMSIKFQRTLRIPDDGKNYPLPPGLGRFPVRHLDDFADRAPASWLDRGGVIMPMYQAEALWLNFNSHYPFAIKIASGKINAITGESWRGGLNRRPQDYAVVPGQPWLDGFAVEKGIIRQFVAMPLGSGYSVEEQLTGKAEFGGIQIQVYPMKSEVYFRKEVLPRLPKRLAEILPEMLPEPEFEMELRTRESAMCFAAPAGGMGLGAGGRMKQEIYKDPNELEVWDLNLSSRCFVHLCDALVWREITGTNPPHPPVTVKEYKRQGLPWFDYYRDDLAVLEGSKKLAEVKSVVAVSKEKNILINNDSMKIGDAIHCGPKIRPELVREW